MEKLLKRYKKRGQNFIEALSNQIELCNITRITLNRQNPRKFTSPKSTKEHLIHSLQSKLSQLYNLRRNKKIALNPIFCECSSRLRTDLRVDCKPPESLILCWNESLGGTSEMSWNLVTFPWSTEITDSNLSLSVWFQA